MNTSRRGILLQRTELFTLTGLVAKTYALAKETYEKGSIANGWIESKVLRDEAGEISKVEFYLVEWNPRNPDEVNMEKPPVPMRG